jgi:large subunit ribosomal protein L32
MAVQKSKVSRSRRNKRRTHDSLGTTTMSTDLETGERHRRHHMTPDGFFKGRQIVRNDED